MARPPRPPVCVDGRVYDKHLVKRMLGRGGTAEVYLAEHTVIRQEVAFKVLREVLRGEPEYVERFNGEARALGELRHPNIVRVIHAGEVAEIGPYMTMEVLEGKMLAQVLSRVELPVSVCVSTLLGLASALEVVHAAGILHRDLKPENIFLAMGAQAGAPTVKLIDFASAKISKYEFEPTRIHLRPGTALYKSPEHLAGGEATVASEVFSLAMIGYEMLAGVHPLSKGAEEGSFSLLERHKEPLVDVATVVPGLPREIAQVIMQALAREPERRFGSMSAFAAALRHAYSGERVAQATQALPTLRRPRLMSLRDALAVELPIGAWKTTDLDSALTQRTPSTTGTTPMALRESEADRAYAELSETETNAVPTLRRAIATTEDVGPIDATVIDAPPPTAWSARDLREAEPIFRRPEEEPMPATVAAPPIDVGATRTQRIVGVLLATIVAAATAAVGLWMYFS